MPDAIPGFVGLSRMIEVELALWQESRRAVLAGIAYARLGIGQE